MNVGNRMRMQCVLLISHACKQSFYWARYFFMRYRESPEFPMFGLAVIYLPFVLGCKCYVCFKSEKQPGV